MWNESRFDDGSILRFRIDNDIFEVESTLRGSIVSFACRLYAVCKNNGETYKVCMGSYAKDGNVCTLKKSYSTSYLSLQNINTDGGVYFEITDSENNIIAQTQAAVCDESKPDAELSDVAVVRAKNLLGSMIVDSRCHDEAGRIAKNTALILSGCTPAVLPCFKKYCWYSVENEKEDFYLSSVNHLICENEFVLAFFKAKKWYFGFCDERLFGICIAADSEASPFVNALDCSMCEKDAENGLFYHAVGIALLDDGQYFYRM